MYEEADNAEKSLVSEFQRNISAQWVRKIEAASEAKKAFNRIGDQCMAFYNQDCGFMWKGPFYEEYLAGVEEPHFKVTINKTSEYVDIYEPYLLWDNPQRYCKPRVTPEFPEGILSLVGGDPQMEMLLGQLQGKKKALSEIRASLMETALNYTPGEQREKLLTESGDALREALIRGRGCLWAESYSHPGSDRKLTGLFFGSVMDLFIDPDCSDPALKTAKWIARRHVSTTFELERKWNLEEGTLKEYATMETADSTISNSSAKSEVKKARKEGKTHDLIVWYEIFSKGGIGTRQIDVQTSQHEVWDQLLGDFVYLAIAPGVPWFLNAPPPHIFYEDEDTVAERFTWPCPLYAMDSRWPVALLDFKRSAQSPWPIPPLASAMGELIIMNILASAATEIAYENRKQVIAYLKSEAKQVKDKLQKDTRGTIYFEIADSVQKSVTDVIQYLNRPGMNNDIWQGLEYVSMNFDKRTGLMPFIYGDQSGAVERSARAVASKETQVSIRPEKMARDVANWQTDAAELERLLILWEMTGKDLVGLIGPLGAYLWDQLIANADPEEICRELVATVEASNLRKPNKERETENLQQMMGWLLPVLQQVAMMRGDEEGVQGLNAFIRAIGKATDQDTSEWQVPPFAPQPDPQMMQMQQLMMQTEVQKGQAEAEAKHADAQKKMAEAQNVAQGGEMESAQKIQEMELDHAQKSQDMAFNHAQKQQEFQFDQMKAMTQMAQEQDKHRQDMRQRAAEFMMRQWQFRQEAALKKQMAPKK